jgi:hypothetical protein
MNLTPSERAAMVKDLEALDHEYQVDADIELFNSGRTRKFKYLESMSVNYGALASALKEGLTFNEIA